MKAKRAQGEAKGKTARIEYDFQTARIEHDFQLAPDMTVEAHVWGEGEGKEWKPDDFEIAIMRPGAHEAAFSFSVSASKAKCRRLVQALKASCERALKSLAY